MNIAVQLAEQNHLRSWRDCNVAGMPHRWEAEYYSTLLNRLSYRCTRCPVAKLARDDGAPPRRGGR